MKAISLVFVVSLSMALGACTHMQQYASNGSSAGGEHKLGAGTTPGVAIGGSIASSMDEIDRTKLARALDKSPGTSTSWVNSGNGTSYTVTPIRKLAVNGNSLCRQYQLTAVRGGNRQAMTGTACVASDGAWSEVNG